MQVEKVLGTGEVVGEVLEVSADRGGEPVGKVLLVGDASEELLGDDDIGGGDGDRESHAVLKVGGLDVAVAVEVAAEDEVEVGEGGGRYWWSTGGDSLPQEACTRFRMFVPDGHQTVPRVIVDVMAALGA